LQILKEHSQYEKQKSLDISYNPYDSIFYNNILISRYEKSLDTSVVGMTTAYKITFVGCVAVDTPLTQGFPNEKSLQFIWWFLVY
jgi:hypothetical protein